MILMVSISRALSGVKWLGASWKTYILEEKMTKCIQMPKEKNQNTRKLLVFLYSREEIDEWLYLRKQFYSIVFTGNLSCRIERRVYELSTTVTVSGYCCPVDCRDCRHALSMRWSRRVSSVCK